MLLLDRSVEWVTGFLFSRPASSRALCFLALRQAFLCDAANPSVHRLVPAALLCPPCWSKPDPLPLHRDPSVLSYLCLCAGRPVMLGTCALPRLSTYSRPLRATFRASSCPCKPTSSVNSALLCQGSQPFEGPYPSPQEADGRRSRTWSVTVLAEGRPVEPVTQKRGRKLLQAFSERLAGQGIELDALLDSPASTKRFNAFLVCYGRQVGLIPSILGGHRRHRQKGVGSEKNGCSPCGIYLLPGCVKIRIRITLPFPGKLCWRHYPVFDVGLVTCCRHAGNDMGSGDAHR